VFGSLLGLVLALAGVAALYRRRKHTAYAATVRKALLLGTRFRVLWAKAGMRSKVKALIGIWQCTSAIHSAYNVTVPESANHLAQFLRMFELLGQMGIETAVPTSCLGSYHQLLLFSTLWPLALLVVIIVVGTAVGVGRLWAKRNGSGRRSVHMVFKKEVENALPSAVVGAKPMARQPL
jgi:hypothetical protein